MMNKPWNPIGIGLLAFFFTFLPGGILMGINYERLNKKHLKTPVIAITVILYILFLWSVIALPDGYNWIFQVIHVGSSIGIALIQRPLYERYRDEHDDEFESSSFLYPIIYSSIFLLVFFGGTIGYSWYEDTQAQKQMAEAQQAYYQGDFEKSANLLKQLMHKNPSVSIYPINLAITYEASGKRDSAIIVLRNFLELFPNDPEVKDKLYKLRYDKE